MLALEQQASVSVRHNRVLRSVYVIIQGRTKVYLELLKSHWGLDGSLLNGERAERDGPGKEIWEDRRRRTGQEQYSESITVLQ